MPKRLCASSGTIRTLATAAHSGILSDLDGSTFVLRKQVRKLPVIHKLFLSPELNSLGYTQPDAKGNPSELHFVDSRLNVVRTVRLPDACTAFAPRASQWIIACRDHGIYCFDCCGNAVWTWKVPRERHFRSAAFGVTATEEGVFAAEGAYLYALTLQGALRWEWEVPNHQEQTRRLSIPIDLADASRELALKTLGLKEKPTPVEIRQAHRRMARLTHPDLNPEDQTASIRFRSVQQAYERLQEASPARQTAAVTISFGLTSGPTNRITALEAQGSVVGIGTSRGEVYLCDDSRQVQVYHRQLGRQCVSMVLLRDGRLDAAFCYPRLYRFCGGSPVASDEIGEYFVRLVPHGDDILVCGWKSMWLFGTDAQLKGSVRCERPIDGVAASRSETLVLSGYLMAIPHG